MERPDPADVLRREEADEFPRVSTFQQVLNSTLLEDRFVNEATGLRGMLYKKLPLVIAQVLEAYRIRKSYDVIITWSEARAVLFALLLKITGSKTPHVSLMYWMSKPKQAALLKHVHSHMHKIVTWSSVQRTFAIEQLGVAPEKIILVKHPVDQKFWRPMNAQMDTICAVGSENRDYATLIEAMRGVDIPCHIAAKDIRIVEQHRATTVDAAAFLGTLPQNVTVGQRPYLALRQLYARSRFTVVPLLPSDTDNGISTILESMAMGKAVICSRTTGQVDAIEEGKTGIFVPQGDAKSLRDAIVYLWNNPEVAVRMGEEGRKYIEQHHTLDKFCNDVRAVVENVAGRGIRQHTQPDETSATTRTHVTESIPQA
jgi:glycosyltransferase involved in cell wall biosynthesis